VVDERSISIFQHGRWATHSIEKTTAGKPDVSPLMQKSSNYIRRKRMAKHIRPERCS
jgi:hypothetical protein